MAKKTTQKKTRGIGGATRIIESAGKILSVVDPKSGDPRIREIMTASDRGRMSAEDIRRGNATLNLAELSLTGSVVIKGNVPSMTTEVVEKLAALGKNLHQMKVHVEGYLGEMELHTELTEFRKIFSVGTGQSGLPAVAATFLRAAGAPLTEDEVAEEAVAEGEEASEALAEGEASASGEPIGEAAAPPAPDEPDTGLLVEAIRRAGVTDEDLAEIRLRRRELVRSDQRQERGKGAKKEAVQQREDVVAALDRWHKRWTKVAREYLTPAQLSKMGIKPHAPRGRKKKSPSSRTREGTPPRTHEGSVEGTE